MAGPVWKNIYRLSDEQIASLDEAEERMEVLDISGAEEILLRMLKDCLLYTSPSPRDRTRSRMPSSA